MITISNIEFNVLYVDPSSSTSGDGSTPANAMNSLPSSISSVQSGTCFIIRRTSSGVTLPKGSSSSINAMAIIGMPKPGDELYGFVPVEATTAWGADAADYATVTATDQSSYESYLTISSAVAFFAYRLNIGWGSSSMSYMIDFSDSSYLNAVSFERCLFGIAGYDLSSATSDAPRNTGGMVRCTSAMTFGFKHNVVHSVGGGGMSGSSSVVYVQKPKFLSVCDIDVWIATDSSYYSSYQTLQFGDSKSYMIDADVEGIAVHYVQRNSYGSIPGAISITYCDYAKVRGLSASMEARSIGSGTPKTLKITTTTFTFTNLSEFDVKGVTANFPKVWNNYGDSLHVLYVSGSSSSSPGTHRTVEDVVVNMASSGGVDEEYGGNYYSYIKQNSSGSTNNMTKCCAVRLQGGTSGMSATGRSNGPEPMVVKNVSVSHQRGVALYASECWVKNSTVGGMFRCDSCTADINSISTWYPGYAIVANGSTIKVGSITLGKGNIPESNSDPAIGNNVQESYCSIYVGSCNGSLMSDNRSSGSSVDNGYMAICASEIDEGHYTSRSENAMCDTWSVARSGSASTASLKFSNMAADGPGYLSIGRNPFAGFSIPATAGSRTLIVYVATKGYQDLSDIGNCFIINASVPYGEGTYESFYSNVHGRWIEDTSTWVGEYGLQAYRIEIPMTIAENCNVDVKMHFRKYDQNGRTYVDPTIIIQ